ncbi:sporulation-specific diadenylate cyclase CdaS [Peribacillus muralis]|uniref:sporulation-specific diadenylate cyclase CdaS n=1 Tax=Peribacillus muralis TaxID=264697 RepID=UPI000AE4E5F7|nr:sporulation-specific diadenylate cyclase CdaS [Peribacillus muralis]MCK1993454.1 sporulation-specific diadenylate cyclase CdaS [Peribacillus muralis]MCK2014258.1 sporulation-specific diadenylate cyclase CdaS [Peribacillus muralis]
MKDGNCDFSPMKQILKEDIRQVIAALELNLEAMSNENDCLLGSFEKIKEQFVSIDMKAATFYLNCYLSPFTDKYPELTISIQNLSNRKHGGLIVIQRQESLETIIQPGISIGAELTHSLLESIFYPGNPLHDGAVLVSQNQISSAANVLPLSVRSTGGKKLGTRHRAALGLTERSDALVLVVSEETGRISFALNGNLYPINNQGLH